MKERDSSIELIRIIAILFILFEHIVVFTFNPVGFPINEPHLVDDSILPYGLVAIFITGVNLFVLISGFFGIRLRMKKLLSLYLCVLFYSIITTIGFSILGNDITITRILKMFLCFDEGWFLPNYIALMLLAPIFNKHLESVSKSSLSIVLICLTFVDVYQGYIRGLLGNENGFNVIHFTFMYYVGAYISRYGIKLRRMQLMVIYLCSTLLIFASTLVRNNGYFAYSYNSPLVIIAAVSLFEIIRGLMNEYRPSINALAKLAFPIFLTNPLVPSIINKYCPANLFLILCLVIFYLMLLAITEYLRNRIDSCFTSIYKISQKVDDKYFKA